MEAALRLLLPKILGDISFLTISFQCKQDLLKQLPIRLKAYKRSLPKNYALLILVDRDSDDCRKLKQKLENMAIEAKLLTKTNAGKGNLFQVINRVVIEELESWFFGDWRAVQEAYPRVSARIPQSAAYRDPDSIRGGTWEAFERVLQNAGYFKTGLAKFENAKAVAQHMDPNRNKSTSFCAFRDAIYATLQLDLN